MDLSRFLLLTSFIALTLVSGLAFSPLYADVYKYVDRHGRIHLTDRPPHKGYQLVIKSIHETTPTATNSRVDYQNKERNRQRFSDKIAATAKRYGLPRGLIHAVVSIESAYDPNAVSRKGAVGLMQLMPETAKRFGVTNRRDPSANLSAGTRYLKLLLQRFNNNLELALAGYNAGENAVEKYGNKIPPFAETQAYVRKVIKLYHEHAERTSSGA